MHKEEGGYQRSVVLDWSSTVTRRNFNASLKISDPPHKETAYGE